MFSKKRVKIKTKLKREEKKRSAWVKPWLLKRDQLGFYDNLLQEFRLEDAELYKNYLRMSVDNFNEILTLVKDDLTKQNTHLRESIPAEVKLAITLRYLATGNTYTDLQYQFRVHKSTISGFVPKVCEVIYEKLKEKYMKVFLLLFFYISFFTEDIC